MGVRVRSSATNAIGAQQRTPQAAQEVQGGRRRRGHRVDLTRDITPAVDEIYPLCLQVYERSKLRFERLTEVYLPARRRDAGPGVLLVRRRRGKAVAFGMCLVHGDTQYAEYLGFDDGVALDLRLYHVFRDLVRGHRERGRWFQNRINYDPKLHLRPRLKPVDLYVRHTYPLINTILRVALPSREPTRHDETLKKFPKLRRSLGRRLQGWQIAQQRRPRPS
jgi:hypothetical protein